MKNKTSYFTFGQSHLHSVHGFTYDKDIVVEITAENPRNEMFKLFGRKWASEYDNKPDMSFFPRGIKKITNQPN